MMTIPNLPTHTDPQPNNIAKAPFNFVPLPEQVFIPQVEKPTFDRFEMNRHSGYIDLNITCETPTYVKCGIDPSKDPPDAKDPKTRDFFHQGNPSNPVIPGSSLRGMIRVLVEVMSFGKMQWLSDKKLVYRAVGDSSSLGDYYRKQMLGFTSNYPSRNIKAGYLKRDKQDQLFIQPALEPRGYGESFVRVKYGAVRHIVKPNQVGVYDAGWVMPVKREKHGTWSYPLATEISPEQDPNKKMVRGWLVVTTGLGNPNNPKGTDKRMHYIVYEPDPDKTKAIPVPRRMWITFQDDEKTDTRDNRRKIKENLMRSEGDPVFYLLDDDKNLVYFGTTMLFRLPYPRSIKEFVPDHLRDESVLDLAESIFGTVRDHKEIGPAIRGRVSFGDCKWIDDGSCPFWQEPNRRGNGDKRDVSPKILGTPKPTAFQEYLTQDQPNNRNMLRHWGNKPRDTTIRGHKFYWHKPWTKDDYWEPQPRYESSQHVVIRPVKQDAKFQGRIRFDNLTSLELGALLTAINLPPYMRHKIGMGKPLAMGTVRLEGTLHLIDRAKRYTALFDEKGQLETGELAPEENSSKAKMCIQEFCQAMVYHHNKTASQKDKVNKADDLWSIPRLRELGQMLTKKPIGGKDHKGYFDYPPLTPQNRLNGRYWRKRFVVPTPTGLVSFLNPGQVKKGTKNPHPEK